MLAFVNISINMTNMKLASDRRTAVKRSYRQGARALAAAETHQRILASLMKRLEDTAYEDIRLEQVAADAGVTVQTVLRRFGSKEELLLASAKAFGEQILERRAAATGGTREAVSALVDDYEITGDVTIRLLAQERFEPVRRVLALGRSAHRDWVERSFARALQGTARSLREQRIAALIVATDVYTWKLLRRDQQRSRQATAAIVNEIVEALQHAFTERN